MSPLVKKSVNTIFQMIMLVKQRWYLLRFIRKMENGSLMQSDREQMTQVSASLSKDINNVIRYWECYPDKFLEEFFGIKLLPYQKILLRAMIKEKKYVSFIK